MAGVSQDFSPHAFPQAKILEPERDGKMSANADVESPSSNRGGYFQSLQGLGEEGEVESGANPLRLGADNAIIEIYPFFFEIGSRNRETIFQHIGRGFHTSETKVIDNAIVGFVLEELK